MQMVNPAPMIGQWYQRSGGISFEVVALDRDDRTIEIQHFDGALEELDLDEWMEDEILSCAPPEDWTGSVDVDPEDCENEYEAEPLNFRDGRAALQYVDRMEAASFSELDLPDQD
jgi:hypothetical protein